jgi:dolichol-phosphate mannosyltransferase
VRLPVSIIVPTRNEERAVAACVERIFAACPDSEVLVVDGGRDATEQALAPLRARFPALRYLRNHDDRGKGHAVSVGIAASRHDLLAQIDADLQFLPEDLPRLLAPLIEGRADLALGTRFASGSRRRPGSVPGLRGLGNLAMSALASALTGQRMTDVLAGMKAWRRSVTASFDWQSDGFSYEVELPIKALRRGFRVVDVPVTTEPRRTGESSVRVVRTAARLGADMLRFRLAPLGGGPAKAKAKATTRK